MKRKMRKLLVAMSVAVVICVISVGAYSTLFSASILPQKVDVTVGLEGSPLNTSQDMWQIYMPSIGRTGDYLYGVLNSGQSNSTSDSQVTARREVRIEVKPLRMWSSFPQSHADWSYRALDFNHGSITGCGQVTRTERFIDVYSFDYSYSTAVFQLTIKSGNSVVYDEPITYTYKATNEWTPIDIPAYGKCYLRVNGIVDNGLDADLSNVRYLAVTDRFGHAQAFLTKEDPLTSLVNKWNSWLTDICDGYIFAKPAWFPVDCMGMDSVLTMGAVNFFHNNYPPFDPVAEDWSTTGKTGTDFWTVLEWGDIMDMLGPENYNGKDANTEMFQFHIDGCNISFDPAKSELELDYEQNQISPSITLLVPLSMADTWIQDLTPCNAAPVLNSVRLSETTVYEGNTSILFVDITNPSTSPCTFSVRVDAGPMAAIPRTGDMTWKAGEQRTIQYTIYSPDVAAGDVKTPYDICVEASSGAANSGEKCTTLFVEEHSPSPGPTTSTTPTGTYDQTPPPLGSTTPPPHTDDGFNPLLIIVLLAVVIGIGLVAFKLMRR